MDCFLLFVDDYDMIVMVQQCIIPFVFVSWKWVAQSMSLLALNSYVTFYIVFQFLDGLGFLYNVWLKILNVSILLLLYTYSDRGRPGSGSIFVGGFVFGGLIVGTLSCVYAPQVWYWIAKIGS